MMENNAACPCASGQAYADCCQPFHRGGLPDNALQLMRSRYSAYALNLADYIVATTHAKSPLQQSNQRHWKKQISQFAKCTLFENLKIRDFTESGDIATVTFTAYLVQNGLDATFTEKSLFERVDNRWYYLQGDVSLGESA